MNGAAEIATRSGSALTTKFSLSGLRLLMLSFQVECQNQAYVIGTTGGDLAPGD